ncbi:hypothetical protein KDE13_00760 [Campylobacter sp. faydin G-140]|uniref:hypothetical protein n=1 Tax=Campylobacter anatolicus TaxID=2829105 RepID=UPI001B905666|nr:hypothetical protein [Campylobacter anatolicus]MBR8462022.1 hypothetical protein [Campylobacter anatolicus]MBR8464891.1 hypothetical protein [Campylobacter anatolicus]
MDRLTQKERIELESVFAVIYTKKESKFMQFYKEFYSLAFSKFSDLKFKIKRKVVRG